MLNLLDITSKLKYVYSAQMPCYFKFYQKEKKNLLPTFITT